MTQEELQQLVENLSEEYFHLPFKHHATFNSRLQTTGGRYHLKDHHLDFNPKMLDFGIKTFEKIILHELCHYHLHLQGQPSNHKDHEFKELLKKVGGLRYAPNVKPDTPKKYFIYQCQSCQTIITRRRQVNTKRFVCGKCRGVLQFKKIEWM